MVIVMLWVGLAVALLTFFLTALIAYLAARLKAQGRRERPRPADVAIILGAYTDGYSPSPTLVARLKAALHLYRVGLVTFVIVSGGRGPDETVSEARSMKRFLILNGIPSDVILEDRHSASTWENLTNSKAVMEQAGLSSAVIVTTDYHLPRALAVAKQLDMRVSGYCSASGPSEFRYARRELLAWGQYLIRGQASL